MVSVNIQERARVLFPSWQGHVAAAERLCMKLHTVVKVLYRGNTIEKVLYQTAHHGQVFVPMVQLPLTKIMEFTRCSVHPHPCT
jgi:hypothetical protein